VTVACAYWDGRARRVHRFPQARQRGGPAGQDLGAAQREQQLEALAVRPDLHQRPLEEADGDLGRPPQRSLGGRGDQRCSCPRLPDPRGTAASCPTPGSALTPGEKIICWAWMK